jgi:hypothetical protein
MKRACFAFSSFLLLASPTAAARVVGDEFGIRWEWAAPDGSWWKQSVSTRQLASSPAASTLYTWFTFPGVSGSVSAVVAFNQQDSALEIGTLAEGRVTTRTIASPSSQASDAVVADVDGDSDLELLVIDEDDLFVYDEESGLPEQTRFGFGGTDLSVGQLDGDIPLELVVSGWLGYCWRSMAPRSWSTGVLHQDVGRVSKSHRSFRTAPRRS